MLFLVLVAENYRGWYGGVRVGMTNRNVDVKVRKKKVKPILEKIGLDPDLDSVLDSFNQHIVFGLKDSPYVEAILGYSWRVKKIWLGVNGFFLYEPRNLDVFIPTDSERRKKDKSMIQLRMDHIRSSGLEGRIGYYLNEKAAIIGVAGLEIGYQGSYTIQRPVPPVITQMPKPIYDAGIRLGLETKIDLNDSASFVLGYHQSFLSADLIELFSSKNPLEGSIAEKLSFYKYRIFVGMQWQWRRK